MTDTPKKRHAISRRGFTAGAAATAALMAGGVPRFAIGAGPLKIGALTPQSGFFAGEGDGMMRGWELAEQLLNPMGYSIKVIHADTESSTDKARTAAEKLINDGAQVLVGAFVSAHTVAIAQVAEQHGVPLIINIAAAPSITEQGYKYVVRNFPTGPMIVGQGVKMVGNLLKTTGFKVETAVLMYANDTFGTAVGKGIKALVPKFGLPFKIVSTIPYDPKARDLSVEIAKAKATGADLVLPVTHGPDAIMLIREMVKGRWSPKAIINPGAPGMYDAQFYKTLGKYSEFIIMSVPWNNPASDMTKRLEAAFTKNFPDDMFDVNVGATFDAALIAAQAYKQAGTADPDALMKAIKATNIAEHVMMGGPITFNEKGQNTNIKMAALQNFGRKPNVVLPLESAVMKPILPMPAWNDPRRK